MLKIIYYSRASMYQSLLRQITSYRVVSSDSVLGALQQKCIVKRPNTLIIC